MVKLLAVVGLTALFLCCAAFGQALYKYQDSNGDWVYTDREPQDGQAAEVRDLPMGAPSLDVTVTARPIGDSIRIDAHNDYPVPVEVIIALDELSNLEVPEPEQGMRWVVDAGSSRTLLDLATLGDNAPPVAEFRFLWLPGDPKAIHDDDERYRAPFAVASNYPISQSFPVATTHQTPDSYYAVDIAMPIGTDVYAARGGVVFEVASTNYRGGIDEEEYLEEANVIRIMHDDGSHAVYAHLNWNTIRVRPGDRVQRGEYIADSGNTGFSSGPHLHFAVLINRGMRLVSVPIAFEGSNSRSVTPTTGANLTAY